MAGERPECTHLSKKNRFFHAHPAEEHEASLEHDKQPMALFSQA